MSRRRLLLVLLLGARGRRRWTAVPGAPPQRKLLAADPAPGAKTKGQPHDAGSRRCTG